MRLPIVRRTQGVGFNMTPMIDVVFQLIIFFLLSSHLAKQEVQLELELPAAETGQAEQTAESPRVTINVLPTGELLLAGKPVVRQQLQARLEAARAEEGPDLEVRIRSDRSVAYQQIEPILLSCARAGIWNVTFAVYPSEEGR